LTFVNALKRANGRSRTVLLSLTDFFGHHSGDFILTKAAGCFSLPNPSLSAAADYYSEVLIISDYAIIVTYPC